MIPTLLILAIFIGFFILMFRKSLFRKPKTETKEPFSPIFYADNTPFDAELSAGEQHLVKIINNYRTQNNLQELKLEFSHTLLAKKRIEYIITRGIVTHDLFFTHSKYLKQKGVKCFEILAQSYSTPKSTLKAWINSEPHHNAILDNKANFVGVCIQDKKYCVTFGYLA